ncbi:MAG: hypothetical protein ACE5JX_15375 [Acidobacteriota bacterium]
MRLSTDPALAGVPWQPFQAEVQDFDLGSLQPGEFVTVHVQFMDEAGNISDNAAGDTSDTTRYLPSSLVATIDYNYRMASGDAGGGQFSLLADGSFFESSAETGRWFFQTVPTTRFILLYDTGFACDAAMVGELTAPGRPPGSTLVPRRFRRQRELGGKPPGCRRSGLGPGRVRLIVFLTRVLGTADCEAESLQVAGELSAHVEVVPGCE